MNDFERVRDFVEDLEARSSSRVEDFAYGRAFFHESFPVVWDMNFARVDTEPPSWRDLAVRVDEIQREAGLHHRKIAFRDEPWWRPLADEARGDGYESTTLIYMIRTGPGVRANKGRAAEVEYDEIRPLRYELMSRQPWAESDDDIRQVLDGNRYRMDLCDGRFFAARLNGRFVAAADLYLGPGVAQVEDVETMKEHRGQGLASDVVLEAAEAATRSDPKATVFLVADEADWPKLLYERMGFETVGRTHQLLRTPSAT